MRITFNPHCLRDRPEERAEAARLHFIIQRDGGEWPARCSAPFMVGADISPVILLTHRFVIMFELIAGGSGVECWGDG